MSRQYWEVTFHDGRVITSEECEWREDGTPILPDEPVTVIIQPGADVRGGFKDGLYNIGRAIYRRDLDCWQEMVEGEESIVTYLRLEGHTLGCYRPGYWVPDFKENHWLPALERLKELQSV